MPPTQTPAARAPTVAASRSMSARLDARDLSSQGSRSLRRNALAHAGCLAIMGGRGSARAASASSTACGSASAVVAAHRGMRSRAATRRARPAAATASVRTSRSRRRARARISRGTPARGPCARARRGRATRTGRAGGRGARRTLAARARRAPPRSRARPRARWRPPRPRDRAVFSSPARDLREDAGGTWTRRRPDASEDRVATRTSAGLVREERRGRGPPRMRPSERALPLAQLLGHADGDVAHERVVVAGRGEERLLGVLARGGDPRERHHRLEAHLGPAVPEGPAEALGRARIADLAERCDRHLPHQRVVVFHGEQQLGQRLGRRRGRRARSRRRRGPRPGVARSAFGWPVHYGSPADSGVATRSRTDAAGRRRSPRRGRGQPASRVRGSGKAPNMTAGRLARHGAPPAQALGSLGRRRGSPAVRAAPS